MSRRKTIRQTSGGYAAPEDVRKDPETTDGESIRTESERETVVLRVMRIVKRLKIGLLWYHGKRMRLMRSRTAKKNDNMGAPHLRRSAKWQHNKES